MCWLSLVSLGQSRLDSLIKEGICCESGFVIPNIDGMPLPKGVVITTEQARNFSLNSSFEQGDSSNSDRVSSLTSARIKLNIPLINNDRFKLITGLKYYQDEYRFKQPEELSNFYHMGLEDKHIKTIGMSFYGLKTTLGQHYWAARLSVKLNGDFVAQTLNSHMKSGLTLMYGKKSNRFKTWGMGLSYSNSFGVSSVYPVWFHKERYTNKFAIDLLLPVYAKLYYLPSNKKNVLYLENRLEGDNYNLNFEAYPGTPLYLEKANVYSRLVYEREIHDFLWFSMSAGYQFNVRYNLSSSDLFFDRTPNPNNRTALLIESNVKPVPVVRLGLFLVPPRKWLEERM